jgi:hypothetical protein
MTERGNATKPIRLSETTKEELENRQRPDESHDDVVWRMLQEAAAVESVDDVADTEAAAALAELRRREAERRVEELEETVIQLQQRMQRAHEELTAAAVNTDTDTDTEAATDTGSADGVEAVIEEADPENTDTTRDAAHAPVWSVRHPDNSLGDGQANDSDDGVAGVSEFVLDSGE